MKRIFIQYIKEFAYWLVFFLLFKIAFVLYNYNLTSQLDAMTIWGIFRHGFVMDLSAAGYMTTLAAVLLSVFPWFPKTALKLTQWATTILLIPLCLMGFGDMGVYPDWGVRLNVGVFAYMKDFRGVIQNLDWWQWIALLLLLAATIALFSWLHHLMNFRLQRALQTSEPTKQSIGKRIGQSFFALVLGGLLILPIRGGLDTSPMSFANVYFSDKLYANHAAYNYFWSFMYTVVNDDSSEAPVHYERVELAAQQTEEEAAEPTHIAVSQPNIIVIFLESFSELMSDKGYTPCLNQLKQGALVWDSCYASGNRSDKGMTATFAGYPALIRYHSIVNYAEKTATLPSIQQTATNNGYHGAFIYSGDVNFYNTRVFMIQQGINDITERSDFPLHISTMQKWGAPDEYLYAKAFDKARELAADEQPYLLITYNISSHPPFDIPNYYKKVQGNGQKELFANSVCYADSCIGVFVDKLKNSGLWENTLLIVTSDHTSHLQDYSIEIAEPEDYRIPMIWAGGAIREAHTYHQIVSQTDLLATLCQQLGWHEASPFSHSMFRKNGFATYYRNELWGYVSRDVKYSVNLESGQRTVYHATDSVALQHAVKQGESYTMQIFDDFLNR